MLQACHKIKAKPNFCRNRVAVLCNHVIPMVFFFKTKWGKTAKTGAETPLLQNNTGHFSPKPKTKLRRRRWPKQFVSPCSSEKLLLHYTNTATVATRASEGLAMTKIKAAENMTFTLNSKCTTRRDWLMSGKWGRIHHVQGSRHSRVSCICLHQKQRASMLTEQQKSKMVLEVILWYSQRFLKVEFTKWQCTNVGLGCTLLSKKSSFFLSCLPLLNGMHTRGYL